MTTARASVVIPAHDEAPVLGRCLTALLHGAQPGEFDVVVVANGCRDDTVAVARGFESRGVRVVETEQASKITALNLGDSSTEVLPRIYLDADVVIDTAAARALADCLGANAHTLAAAPRMHVDTSRSSRTAQHYLNVWQNLPVFRESYLGSGCYAVSATGRSRWQTFPDVLGDDRFVNCLFSVDEKITVAGHRLDIIAPRTLPAIVRRSLRVRSGTRSLDAVMAASGYSVRDAGGSTGTRAYLRSLLLTPGSRWPAVIFTAAQVWIQVVAAARAVAGRDAVWLRDETSRTSKNECMGGH